MKKGINNTRVNFTIQKDVLKLLDAYAEKTMIPKSRLVSKLLKDFIEKENSKNNPKR